MFVLHQLLAFLTTAYGYEAKFVLPLAASLSELEQTLCHLNLA